MLVLTRWNSEAIIVHGPGIETPIRIYISEVFEKTIQVDVALCEGVHIQNKGDNGRYKVKERFALAGNFPGGYVRVTLLGVSRADGLKNGQVKMGFEADREVSIDREEIYFSKIKEEQTNE